MQPRVPDHVYDHFLSKLFVLFLEGTFNNLLEQLEHRERFHLNLLFANQ